tara:strand:+ start:4978 stop:5871 length:894 start_codon:yes stop_codon:yes gene_type:complete
MKNKILIIILSIFILNIGFVLAQVPTYHQFYGDIYDGNNTLITEDMPIVAKINNTSLEEGISSSELYGYDSNDLFIVEDGVNGQEIEFYVYGMLSGTFIFENEKTTNLDLTLPCGDGVLDSGLGEECDTGNITETCATYGHSVGSVVCDAYCKVDASACSTPGSPGNGGSPGGSYTPPSRVDDCNESWICGDWGECDGVETRTCLDENNCGTEDDKPVLTNACEVIKLDSDEIKDDIETPRTTSSFSPIKILKNYWIAIVIIILTIIIGIFSVIFIRWKIRDNEIEKIRKKVKKSWE